jgi:tyrosyl-tRNA synthetase
MLKTNKTGKFAVFDLPSVNQTAPAAPAKKAAAAAAPAAAVASEENLYVSPMSVEEKVAIAKSVGEEVIQEEELVALYNARPNPIVYDGFEPSGRMHIAQGVLRAINVNKLTSTGCIFKFWVADWFAQLNNKMGGDLNKIKTVGQYMIEIWKAIGMDMTNVRFLWASEEINSKADEYWTLVMDIARVNNLKRIQRCCTIMGRKEDDEMSAAQIFYPCMQAADVFFLKADICQLGMDQRKVNMLAREYAGEKKKRFKPIIISHHMLMGLKEGQEKMSKSDPDSAIFMEDAADDVKRKIKKAYCPPEVVEANPIMDYAKNIVLGYFGKITINIGGVGTHNDQHLHCIAQILLDACIHLMNAIHDAHIHAHAHTCMNKHTHTCTYLCTNLFPFSWCAGALRRLRRWSTRTTPCWKRTTRAAGCIPPTSNPPSPRPSTG